MRIVLSLRRGGLGVLGPTDVSETQVGGSVVLVCLLALYGAMLRAIRQTAGVKLPEVQFLYGTAEAVP